MIKLDGPQTTETSHSKDLVTDPISVPIALEFECVLSVDHFHRGLEQILEMICDRIIENQEGTSETDRPT